MKASEVVTLKYTVISEGKSQSKELKSTEHVFCERFGYNGIVVIDDIMRRGNVIGTYEDGDLTLANDGGSAFKLTSNSSNEEKIVDSEVIYLEVFSLTGFGRESLNDAPKLRVRIP